MNIPNTTEALMKLAHEDPRTIIESGFWVIDKKKNIVPFVFNDLQLMMYNERTIRDDILKPGQIGFSTMILAILTVKFLLVPNAWCVCISHEAEATKRLFEKVDFFLSNLPPWLKPFYEAKVDTKKNLVNGVMNSRFYIGTAGAVAFGRGDTIHYAHLSEVSRWRDSGAVATGIIRAVPVGDPNTWIVKETTANGVGTYHHEEYQRAKRREGEFTSHFFPWYLHGEYTINDIVLIDKTEDEIILQRQHPEITDGRLAWRRKMVGSLNSESGWTPEDMFKQEFPCDDVEAFLFTGNPVFPVAQMQNYKVNTRKPIFVGNLEGVSPHERLDETEKGYLKLWDMPTLGSHYIIAADTAQFTDYCSAHIIDRKTWKIIGTFHAQIKANHFGAHLNRIGHFFNKALIVVEDNNMGQSTIDRLVELDYPSLYYRQRFNKETKQTTSEIGFHTDAKTKPLFIGYLQDIVRTEQADIPEKETVDEMMTFVRNDDGSMGASKGNHDDRVMSLAIAYYVMKMNPVVESSSKMQVKVRPAKKFREFRSTKKTGMKRRIR